LRDAPLDRLPIGFKPFLIKRERLLLLAGLWSTREGDDGSESPVSCVDFSDRGVLRCPAFPLPTPLKYRSEGKWLRNEKEKMQSQ
jgi:hypothetical protein